MQSYSMDHKKDVFLEHLKQKYPHHASVIMGHQERLREQIRSAAHSVTTQSAVGEPGEHLSLASLDFLEAMSEGETPSAFTRGSLSRASLPVVKSTNQTRDRSLGVLYLQYGEETKQIRMPNKVTSADTIRALFISAFPQHLNMKTLESPSVSIYIKDDMRNMYYELTDVRNITPQSCLKVYHKDPAQAFSHNARAKNGDIRITRERLYSSRQQPGGQSPVHTLPGPHSPIHTIQGSMSPPTPRSMPSSPSRMPYSHSVSMMGGATLPRDHLSSVPPCRSITPCSSAILERRDVKPDDDLSSKIVPLYEDHYAPSEARLSIASSHGSHTGDVPDGVAYIQHRSSIKSTGTYTEGQDQQHTLYRQKSRKYSESQLTSMGSKSLPASPHRVNEVRMIDMHPGQNSHISSQGVAVERGSPVKRSFRKDSNGTMEVVTRVRSNMSSPVFADLPTGHGERPFHGHVSAGDPQAERIKAMEQQISSLTGLVQNALFKGTNTSVKETSSERVPAHNINNGGVCAVASSKNPAMLIDIPSTQVQTPSRDPAVWSILSTFRRNISDLRLQLHQLKQMQLHNQEAMRQMLQQAEQEISGKASDTLLHLEDPVHRQRIQVDEERHRYLGMEESVLIQLGELENYMEKLKQESTSATSQRPINLKDVEEGAVNLSKVGEALAALKGEFPALQMKMHAVLRVEVEAVRFLKDDPHKMDGMLKRVKALTDTLSGLRRYATESHSHASDSVPVKAVNTDSFTFVEESRSSQHVCDSRTPQPRSPAKISCSDPTPSSPGTVHRVQTAPVNTHHPTPPLTPTHNRDSPTVAKVSPCSRENSPALHKRAALKGQDAPMANTAISTTGSPTPLLQVEEITVNTSRPRPEEVLESKAEEDEGTTRMVHSGGTEVEKEMDRILQQTQASLMEAIPNLELSHQVDNPPSKPPNILPEEVDPPIPIPPVPVQTEVTLQVGYEADKPVKTSLERPQKPAKEKPHRASVDRVKLNLETASKLPPPPPPRRFYLSATGLTTGRSGEVICTTRKESTSSQEGKEEAPQHKPLRVPPEVKPKPRTPLPVNTLTLHDEEDEGDKIMAELQTTTHPSEEGSLSVREDCASPSSGVIYYITGTAKTSSESTSRAEDPKKSEEITCPPNVASVNASDLSIISLNSVKEAKSKLSDTQQVSPDPVNSFKDSPAAGKEASLINPIEHKNELVLKSLKQVVPKSSEKFTPVEKSEQQIERTSSEQVFAPVQEMSLNQGQCTTTVQVTLVGKSPHNVKPQIHSPFHQPNTDASWSSQQNDSIENEQQAIMRSSRGEARYIDEASLSPDLPGEEGPPPPNNIAFRITKTKVQALSNGEYQQLVHSKGMDVQTLKVGPEPTVSAPEDSGYDKKPVIIIFDEPMDICQAYKRLSTVFECEEELERVLSEERIDEENEEEMETISQSQVDEVTPKNYVVDSCRTENQVNNQRTSSVGNAMPLRNQSSFLSPSVDVEDEDHTESSNGTKQDSKKKFKFKFPKKQLAAIGQALRTGTKTGKKTLQVVVYEDEEEPDGTMTGLKETKRFEIKTHADSSPPTPRSSMQSQTATLLTTKERTEELRKTTYQTLDCLEQTIKQLESTISNIEPALSAEVSRKDSKLKRISSLAEPEAGGPTERPAPLKPKPSISAQHKRPKTQSRSSSSTSTSSSSSSKQNSGDCPASNRISSPKSRQQPGSVEKPGKPQKIQDSQRQFRQVVLL
ncbi:sickle tail protein homolog isoform X1 [Xyrauchen texanus]|uniref:sickle tail protein homolog isoform X1 n=1 Tax=Xyrauchen texanus TaxID=154827 RepID=UPI002241E1DE|nr:sickle tail protein homolog isoform X1 [Xyrauchen texanus]